MKISSALFPYKEIEMRLQVAKNILNDIGENLLYRQKRGFDFSEQKGDYLLIQLRQDNAVEIKKNLQKYFPYDNYNSVLDAVQPNDKDRDFTWYIEPMDGVRNYVCGIPYSCIALGLHYQNNEAATLVYDFPNQSMFQAIIGAGAFRNNQKIISSKKTNLQDAFIGCYFEQDNKDHLQEWLVLMSILLQEKVHFRLTGCPILDICTLCQGRYDAFWGISSLVNKFIIMKALFLETHVMYSTFAEHSPTLHRIFKNSLIAANKSLHMSLLNLMQEKRQLHDYN